MSRSRRPGRILARVAIALAVPLAGALLAGVIYEQNARRAAATTFPPPGQMVDIGGRRMHLNCLGHGLPVVILEAGADASGSPLREPIQQQVAQFTRVCAYDRAGIMWSDPGPEPRDAEAIAADLHAALTAASVPPPYVMAGASMAGAYVMVFTREYPDEVAGVVLVDASHPDQTARLVAAAPREQPFDSRSLSRPGSPELDGPAAPPAPGGDHSRVVPRDVAGHRRAPTDLPRGNLLRGGSLRGFPARGGAAT